MDTIYLIDANVYIHRAWSAIPEDVVGAEGQCLNAFFGFTHFVSRIIKEREPRFVALAFDGGKSFRHRLYKDYKSNRSPKDPRLIEQIDWCRRWGEAMGMRCIRADDYEADDVVGTIGRHYRNEDFRCHYVSKDKDLAQLVRLKDRWWGGKNNRALGYEEVYQKFEVYPEQIADWLALVGDSADCIKGVPGIGKVRASQLLRRHGSAHLILEKRLIPDEHIEGLQTALALTQIVCEVPLSYEGVVTCQREGADEERLKALAQMTLQPEPIYRKWTNVARSRDGG